MSEPDAKAPLEPKPPVWKNPFVIAFVVGALFLTVLPFLQRRFLKAPPPIATVPPLELALPDAGAYDTAQLKGDVWVARFTRDGCAGGCGTGQKAYGAMLKYLDSKGAPIRLVSIVVPSPDGGALADTGDARWLRLGAGGEAPLLLHGFRDPFLDFTRHVERGQLVTLDAGTTLADFADLPVLALIDQEGGLRGFWKDDEVGRGNVINAALLLSKYGPRP